MATGQDIPEGMSELEWLVALEQIRQLKARRDRCIDARDWEEYEALHAVNHHSRHASVRVDPTSGPADWTSAAEMTKNSKAILTDRPMIHHSYDPEIVFDSPTRARGLWAMTDAGVYKDAEGSDAWHLVYGYYYETYEKQDGRWVFTERRWQRYFGANSNGLIPNTESLPGSDAFDREWP